MPLNSRLSDFASAVADLIAPWRAEISQKKDYRTTIATKPLTAWFDRAKSAGLPSTLGAYTVLVCEWTFRIRRATEDDIERVLYEMERGLCKPESPVLNRFQAHILIKSLESKLRKHLAGVRIPIVLGFPSETPQFWPYYQGEAKRQVPRRVVPRKRGRLPIVGPVLAGVLVDMLLNQENVAERADTLGQDLCSILLERKVLAVEFSKWGKKVGTLRFEGDPLLGWLAERMRVAHRRIFEQDAITLDRFLHICKTNPEEILWFARDPQLLAAVFSIAWGGSKNLSAGRSKKRRISAGRKTATV